MRQSSSTLVAPHCQHTHIENICGWVREPHLLCLASLALQLVPASLQASFYSKYWSSSCLHCKFGSKVWAEHGQFHPLVIIWTLQAEKAKALSVPTMGFEIRNRYSSLGKFLALTEPCFWTVSSERTTDFHEALEVKNNQKEQLLQPGKSSNQRGSPVWERRVKGKNKR